MNQPQNVCVRIIGGLGNQMFQYAAGHALAKRHGVELLVDPVRTALDHTVFGLDVFGLQPKFWEPAGARARKGLSRLFGRKASAKKRVEQWNGSVFKQKNFCSTDGFDVLPAGTYLDGFFQSEGFFAEYAQEIRSLFSLDHLAETLPSSLLAKAAEPSSVSVHIRRGDYIKDPKTTAIHGVLSDDHYLRCHDVMTTLVPDCQWLVFSDEPDAADSLTREWKNRTLVTGNSREADLHLMSRCSHHVIANSSFSWWGAWLGRNPARQVIAPRRWMSRAQMQGTYVDDVCPVGWILL